MQRLLTYDPLYSPTLLATQKLVNYCELIKIDFVSKFFCVVYGWDVGILPLTYRIASAKCSRRIIFAGRPPSAKILLLEKRTTDTVKSAVYISLPVLDRNGKQAYYGRISQNARQCASVA